MNSLGHLGKRSVYPVLRGELSAADQPFFDLAEFDMELVLDKRGPANRLGFALQLTLLRRLGRVPKPKEFTELPASVVEYVGVQLGIEDPASVVLQYGAQDGLTRRHAQEIRTAYGWKPFPEGQNALKEQLASRADNTEDGVKALQRIAVAWLLDKRVELPGESTLYDVVRKAREDADTSLWAKLLEPFGTPGQYKVLDDLIVVPEGELRSPLAELVRRPGKPTWENLLSALGRRKEVLKFGLPLADPTISPRRLTHLAKFATERELRGPKRRAAVVAALTRLSETSTDDAVDILDHLLDGIIGRARRKTNNDRIALFEDLLMAAVSANEPVEDLFDSEKEQVDPSTGEITVPAADTTSVREFINALGDRRGLEEASAFIKTLAPPPGSDFERARRAEMIKRFPALQERLLQIGELLPYAADPDAQHVLEALWSLPSLLDGSVVRRGDIDERLLVGSWKELVLGSADLVSDAVDEKAYAFCVVETFHSRLRSHKIFVEGASKWGDPKRGLLRGKVWAENRESVAKSLNLPLDPAEQLRRKAGELHRKLRLVADRLPKEKQVKLDASGQLRIDPAPLPRDPRLRKLLAEIERWMPTGDLPQVLLEVLKRTDGGKAITTPTGQSHRLPDFDVTLSAALVALGCNVGIDAVTGNNSPLNKKQIAYVADNLLRPACLEALNDHLLAEQATIDVAKAWRGGYLASVAGQRFVAPPTSLEARASADGTPYTTWVTMLSDQAMSIAGKVVAGSPRTSLHVLDVLNDRRARPTPEGTDPDKGRRIIADPGPHEDIVFGLLTLSGYLYAPTPAHLSDTALSRMDTASAENYGPLQQATRQKIDSELIAQQWDEMLRLVGSVHRGLVSSEDAIRMVIKKGRPTPLGQAIAHYGRIPKTIHILDLFDNPDFRRQIEAQSNLHEARHKLAAKIYHGTEERIHRYQTGMEEQLGALGLILNMIVLFNTLYIDVFLKKKAAIGRPVPEELVPHLSAFIFKHINMKGRYAFEMPELPDGIRAVGEPEDFDIDSSPGTN